MNAEDFQMSATRMMMNASRLFASGVALKMPRLCA